MFLKIKYEGIHNNFYSNFANTTIFAAGKIRINWRQRNQ